MNSWTLKYKDEEKTLAEWGVKGVRRSLVSQDIDTVKFSIPAASVFDDPPFAEGEIVEIFYEPPKKSKVRWFYGRAEDASPRASGRTAAFEYTLSGPWWWLAHMGFRQSWKTRPDLTKPDLVEQFTSYCLLGSKADGFGTRQSIADQIAEAVNYAIGQGAPLQFDSQGLSTVLPPIRDAWNAPVSEVIQQMIQWAPDIVCEFDYSTMPLPTLRMRPRARQDEAVIDLGASIVSDWEIRPRNDLKVPGVIVYYIRADSSNGSVYTGISQDKFPVENFTGREPKALLAAINLEGANVTYLEAQITCVPIAPFDVAWWARHDAQLHKATGVQIKANSATFTDENGNAISPLANELFGQWAPWMGGAAQSLTVRALASWTEKTDDNANTLLTVVDRPILASITATNLASGVYKSQPGGVDGEAQPIGLAEAIYSACNVLHYDGQLSLAEAEFTGAVSLGDVLNLTGGREEWKTMRAQVQRIEEELDSRKTTVIFGPPKHLGATDYIELLRATRLRIRYALPESRSTGVAGSSTGVLGQELSKQVATQAQGGVTQQVWIDPRVDPTQQPVNQSPNPNSTPTPGRVVLDLNDTGGKEIRLREVDICINDVSKKMRIWASEPY